jgi:hypothetical protein
MSSTCLKTIPNFELQNVKMKYVKIVINDTIIIDDINETYICIYFPENIKNFRNNNYIASTIYINRFDGTIKNNYNEYSYGIELNNFKIINNFKKINFNFKNFIKNNKFVIDYKNKNFKFYIPFSQQSI